MIFSILHLNIERQKHLKEVIKLIEVKSPDVICLIEILNKDAKNIASLFGYEFVFSPRFIFIYDDNNEEEEGVAIFSKYKIFKSEKHNYGENIKTLPSFFADEIKSNNHVRPQSRFSENFNVLSVLIKLDDKKNFIIATTHFPVVDHNIFGLEDHEFSNTQSLTDVVRSMHFLDRLIPIIRSLPMPLIFTADLNNPRGEHIYDTLAHELIDLVPISITSSIDKKLHKRPDLELMVDTIMASHDFIVENFEVIESVSDHKAFLVLLNF